MSTWSEKKLGDICETNGGNIRTGPFGTQLHKSDYQEEGIPVVNPQDLIDGSVNTSSVARVGENHVERLSQHKLKEGDIIYARRGDIGRRAYITEREAGWLCGTGCLKIDTGNDELDSKFLFYYLGDEKVTEWIYNQAVGATMANLNTSILSDVTVRYPSIDRQNEIASILSSFDDLITNNSRRIEILEEMARRIYREWFVHFRYPGHEDDELVDSGMVLGEIPEGWEVKEVDDIVNRLSKGNIYRKKNTDDEGDIIIIDQSTDEYLGFHDNEPDFPASPDKPSIIFGDHTCKMQLLIRPFSLGPNVVPFIAENEELSNYYLYYLLEPIIESREYKRHWTTFKVKKVTVASNELAKIFEEKVRPLIEQKENLKKQVNKLKETRDLLLPKLISGKVQDLN